MSPHSFRQKPILLIKDVIRHLNFLVFLTLLEGEVHGKRRVELTIVGDPWMATMTPGVGEVAEFCRRCLFPFVVDGKSRVT